MNKSLLILTTILFLFSKDCLSVGFNSITSPDGLFVIAVGDSGVLYRSSNSGVSYSSSTISNINLNCIVSLNNNIWICGQNGNIYATSKTGPTVINYYVGINVNLNSIFFVNSNIGFVCGDNGMIFKSTNGGINWFLYNSGITSVKLNSIHFKDVNNGTVVGNNGTIYVTNTGGLNWSSQASGTTKNLLKAKYFSDSLVIVGEYGSLFLNSGNDWSSISTRTSSDIRGVSGININNVHICGGGGFIRNNRNNNVMFSNFEFNPMMVNLVDIFYFDYNIGFAVSSLTNAIIRTTNSGSQWELPIGTTVTYNWVVKPGASGNFLGNNMSLHPTDRNTVFIAFGNQVYRSKDKGENWQAVGNVIPSGSTPHSFFVSPIDTNIWLVATESSPDRIYRTTNYGVSWTQVHAQNFSNYSQPLEMDQNNPHIFYFAPDNGGFWKSTDDGATFTEISGNYAFRSPCDIIVAWDNSDIIFVADGITGSGQAKIYKSVNGGVNWTLVHTAASSEVPSIANSVFEKNVIWATEWSGSNIYRSTNFGDNWVTHHSNSFSGWASDVCREDPTMIITGSWGAIATISLDGGLMWTNISSGLSGHGGGILIPNRDYVLCQQGSNVYKLNISYSYIPDSTFIIDVQSLSVGHTGIQSFENLTINPTGIVKNNSSSLSTFTVTRKISPGGYNNTQTITNLLPNSISVVTFAPWTFTSGVTYTIKDSVYILYDFNTSNDTLSGFLTPILGQSYYPLIEAFNSVSFPPLNWSLIYSGTSYWFRSTVSSHGLGSGSAKFNYWNASSGIIQSFVTKSFYPTLFGDSLIFDNAYAPFTIGTDSLNIETSTNNGITYSTLVRLFGNNSAQATLNSTGVSIIDFTPNSSQWVTKSFVLPVGTNKIKFTAVSGNGNNLYIDSIRITSYNIFTQANIKIIPEALYNRFTLNQKDTVSAYLRNVNSPFNKIDSAKGIIDTVNFITSLTFKYASTGTYYVQINHRNSIETWSKSGGEAFDTGVNFNFDFTSSQSQAYGSNLTLKFGYWCIYSGDVNQSGFIDGSDMLMIHNDANNFVTGYSVTDLNGDKVVDGSDMVIADNNAYNFVAAVTPLP